MDDKKDLDFIPIDIEDVMDIPFDEDNFKKGIEIGSLYSGVITSLVNTGLNNDDAVTIVVSLVENNAI